jgi:hypothetical protein
MKFLIHRFQLLQVKRSWFQQSSVLEVVTWIRLIDWIKSDNIFVAGKSFACDVPELDELVLDTVCVVVKRLKRCDCFWSVVIMREVLSLAVFN